MPTPQVDWTNRWVHLRPLIMSVTPEAGREMKLAAAGQGQFYHHVPEVGQGAFGCRCVCSRSCGHWQTTPTKILGGWIHSEAAPPDP
jgi:hypothetical protein